MEAEQNYYSLIDKRYIHDNGTSSYAYGHYKIK